MRPQDKFFASACHAVPLSVFLVLFEAIKPERRWLDNELFEGGCEHHLILIAPESGSRLVCFYVEPTALQMPAADEEGC